MILNKKQKKVFLKCAEELNELATKLLQEVNKKDKCVKHQNKLTEFCKEFAGAILGCAKQFVEVFRDHFGSVRG